MISYDECVEQLESCVKGNICQKQCAFLEKYGNPGQIVENIKNDPAPWRKIAFECSLCGLCTALCPKDLNPALLFLRLRQKAVAKGEVDLSVYRQSLNYEKKGSAEKSRFYHLPKDCSTVFFPGCSLSGTRPGITLKTYQTICNIKGFESAGMVLDCCSKISHDLGLSDQFHRKFDRMMNKLKSSGVKQILAACPGCFNTLNRHADGIEIRTVYEILAQAGVAAEKGLCETITIHDACTVRFNSSLQDSARKLLTGSGLEIVEMAHSKKKTLCCGEGGSVSKTAPEFVTAWADKRADENKGFPVACYCVGCTNFLARRNQTFHILDLIFEPEKTIKGKRRLNVHLFSRLKRKWLKAQVLKSAG